MHILNLVDIEKSDIKYQWQQFPDGQQQVVIMDLQYEYFDYGKIEINKIPIVQIKSRLNNWLDLEKITCAVASLRELEVEEIHLYIPYIMGARSDRKFEEGGNNYLRDVICPAINALNFKTVTCIDPHSDVLEACIKGFRKINNTKLVDHTISSLYGDENVEWNKFILISPDAGASKKIYKLAEQIGYKGDIITCNKERDKDGKLTKTIIPFTQLLEFKDVIIIDDICDGGATFINIVKEINKLEERYPNKSKMKKYLIVTHGIFSKGFEELSQYFDGIYCTNSYRDIRLTQPINDILGADPNFLQQLNVF